MCGRYFIYEKTQPARVRDIRPSETAAVIVYRHGKFVYETMGWGFIPRSGSGLVINARAESALERPMFSESIRHRRCIIEAGGYYEWNKCRQKATFSLEDAGKLYMAGCYRYDGDGDRFVIVTTAANASVEKVHDRMPLILSASDARLWLSDDGAVEFILHSRPVPLKKYMEFEQEELHF